MTDIKIKRVYDQPHADDGLRTLISVRWPRGLSRERAAVDYWPKSLSPTNRLMKEWGHDADRFYVFYDGYTKELENNPAFPEFYKTICAYPGTVTLLYRGKHPELSNAFVLRDFIERYGKRDK